jgi:hypothetical protein
LTELPVTAIDAAKPGPFRSRFMIASSKLKEANAAKSNSLSHFNPPTGLVFLLLTDFMHPRYSSHQCMTGQKLLTARSGEFSVLKRRAFSLDPTHNGAM